MQLKVDAPCDNGKCSSRSILSHYATATADNLLFVPGNEPFDRDVIRLGGYQYTGHMASLSSFLATRRQTRLILDALEEGGGLSICDVGCGDGKLTHELTRQGRSVLGIDLSVPAVKTAQSHFGERSDLRFLAVDVAELIRSGETFDVVVLRGVLHHAEDPEGLVALASSLANTVIILEPNGYNPVLKVIEKVSRYHREHGERSFRKPMIEKWITNAGMRVTKCEVAVIVPYFAPDWFAKTASLLEPFFERVAGIRWLWCGTQVFVAQVEA